MVLFPKLKAASQGIHMQDMRQAVGLVDWLLTRGWVESIIPVLLVLHNVLPVD